MVDDVAGDLADVVAEWTSARRDLDLVTQLRRQYEHIKTKAAEEDNKD